MPTLASERKRGTLLRRRYACLYLGRKRRMGRHGATWLCSCPVHVDEIGYPELVGRIEIAPKFELAARLQVWLESLRGSERRAGEMLEMASALKPYLPASVDLPTFINNVRDSDAIVQSLIELSNVEKFDLAKIILEVDEDVLGAFMYDGSEGKTGYRRSYSTDISLYWGVIGFFARRLDVSVEGLTIKVLAHEYAHAYTHLGFNRRGKRWSGFDFHRCEHSLREGLAQYWAVIALESLKSRVPNALAAYEALLPRQPAAYRAHLPWLDSYSPDTVAAALIRLRPTGPISYERFCDELARLGRDRNSSDSESQELLD